MQEQQGTTTALRITLGLHIEQWQGPHPGTSLGRATVGRQAFLAMLETWLGLSSLPVSLAERTAAFLLALRQSDGPGRFFHDSLAADEIGTAARLLQWRDEWILGGWTGAAGADGRLAYRTWPLSKPPRPACSPRGRRSLDRCPAPSR
ncbi:hypothetical protein WJ966_21575 [Achromobacter xylosoxidans]